MTTQPDVESRNALLDELKTAADEWFRAEEKRLLDEVTFVKSTLRGRTGSERVARSNTAAARVLVVDDIQSFLAGV
jgi:hypothetical protein